MPAQSSHAEPVDRLIARVPADVRAELVIARATLTVLAPIVVAAMRRIHPLTGAVEEAMRWPADLSAAQLEPATDVEVDAAMDRLGVTALWRLADALVDAHPDRAGAWSE
jgi:hypothetical protein